MGEFNRKNVFRQSGRGGPRTRATTGQVIDGKVSQGDSATFIREESTFLDEDLTTRKVSLHYSRLCDCGRLISQKNSLHGQCQHCDCEKFLCAECVRVCRKCGRTVCSQHSVELDEDAYCRRCAPTRVLWKIMSVFFDLESKENGK